MIIQLLSDTHGDLSYFKVNDKADLIIHAGDISDGFDLYEKTKEFHDLCVQHNKDYLFVLGNHDYYHTDINETPKVYDSSKLLSKHNVVELEGKTFIGCTLWSGFYGVPNTLLLGRYLNDFSYIKNFFIEKCIEEHYKDLEFIEQYRGNPNTVLITHFPLCQEFLDPKFEGNVLNPYFVNNIDPKGFPHIIGAHTHHTMRKDGFYINAYGYINSRTGTRECPQFDTNYLIEI